MYYWIASTAMCINFGDLISVNLKENVYMFVIVIFGYLLFTYFVVVLSGKTGDINLRLTLYQQYLKTLIRYMRIENVSKATRRCVVFF